MNFTRLGVDETQLLEETNDGTGPFEVYSTTFFIPISSLLMSVIGYSLKLSNRFVSWAEVIFTNLVLLLALTSFSNNLGNLFMSLVFPVLTAFFYIYVQARTDLLLHVKKCINISQGLDDFNKKFIGDYRGHLLLATSICILAVDFDFFPVRFSKTETYGWSIMDAGVGSFVLIHGICSSSARNSTSQQNSLKKCILSSFPLFMLGVIRLAATTAVGYHKVVPEYGVHWNFFFTLALTKVLCYILSSRFYFIQPSQLATLVLVFHQTLLSLGLTEFILSDFRRNFLEANKEGICSLLGFVAIYFYGVQLGQFLWRKRDKMQDYIYLFVKILACGIGGWFFMELIHESIQPVSRRMANSAYCIWVVILTSLQIAVHLAHQIIYFILGKFLQKEFDCLLWNAINYNGLFYSLLANVLTGLVNLAIKTENCEEWSSLLILVAYLAILTASVIILYKKKIQLKFW